MNLFSTECINGCEAKLGVSKSFEQTYSKSNVVNQSINEMSGTGGRREAVNKLKMKQRKLHSSANTLLRSVPFHYYYYIDNKWNLRGKTNKREREINKRKETKNFSAELMTRAQSRDFYPKNKIFVTKYKMWMFNVLDLVWYFQNTLRYYCRKEVILFVENFALCELKFAKYIFVFFLKPRKPCCYNCMCLSEICDGRFRFEKS